MQIDPSYTERLVNNVPTPEALVPDEEEDKDIPDRDSDEGEMDCAPTDKEANEYKD